MQLFLLFGLLEFTPMPWLPSCSGYILEALNKSRPFHAGAQRSPVKKCESGAGTKSSNSKVCSAADTQNNP